MKGFLAAALVVTAAMPAAAQWRYDPAQSMATAYCAAKAAGRTDDQAMNAATAASIRSMGGSFGTQLFGVLTQGRELWQQASYIVAQMCPELAGPSCAGRCTTVKMGQPVEMENGKVDYAPVFR